MLLRPIGPCAYTALLLWATLSLRSAAYVQKNTSTVPDYTLRAGISSVPLPLSVAPDQGWAGIDGQWNTITLRVGSQQSVVQVLPSTASQQIWVVNTEACKVQYIDTATNTTLPPEFDSDCEHRRGFVFNTNQSSTWFHEGYYDLWIGGTYGTSSTGYYGFDDIGLGLPGEEGPAVSNTTIGTLKFPSAWLGHLGLHPKSTNFSSNLLEVPPVPSYMTRLFEQGNIPSISFGYTAGAQYHDAVFLSSLTLGGYDASRYIPNNVSFVFSPDNERDLTIGLAGLTASTATESDINLIPDGLDDVALVIDTTVAELWLPEKICEAFEKAFGLMYDNATRLYLVDDMLHQTLKVQNPNVTITLHQSYTTNRTVQITLPYGAFDLEAQTPYQGLAKSSRYFPLRRGKDKSQWALGRMFLQEAYITVDWERARFSVQQVDWTYGKPADIVSIVSPRFLGTSNANAGTSDSHTGVKIGVAVGCVFLVGLIAAAVVGYYWRRRRKVLAARRAAETEAARKSSPTDTDEAPCSPVSEGRPNVFPKAELPGHSDVRRYEMGVSDKEKGGVEVLEVEDTEQAVYEMLGDVPTPQEAGSRQLSEKESMMVRERNINGVDPSAESQAVSPIARPAPIASLEHVAMVSPRLPGDGASPGTPRAPRDGALMEAGDTSSPLPPYWTREGRWADSNVLSPISPLDGPLSSDTSRRRFSYES